jgi:hypothetical protein
MGREAASKREKSAVDSPGRGIDSVVLFALLVMIAAVTVSLATMQIDRTPAERAGRENLANLWPFWIAAALCWLLLTVVWREASRRPNATTSIRSEAAGDAPPGAEPSQRGFRQFVGTALLIMFVATGARIAVLALHEPGLSDDVYRYVFDGRNHAAGINPYLVVPQERVDADVEAWSGERAIVERINHPELTTIYLPTSQWTFSVLGRILPEAWQDPSSSARFFRAAMVCIEMVMMILLALALYHAGRSAWWLALYAWHPLPLSEIAGSGHQDVIGMTLLVAALLAATRWPMRTWLWTLLLAPAVLVKPIVLPVAAFLLRGTNGEVGRARSRKRRWGVSFLLGVIVCAVIAVPLFFVPGGQPLEEWRSTAERFALKWAHFGSVYEPLLMLIEWCMPTWTNDPQEQLARGICLLLVVAMAVWLFLSRLNVWQASMALMLVMVLFSPTAHPWYALWALALLPMAYGTAEIGPQPSALSRQRKADTRQPSFCGAWGVWVLSFTILFGYAQLGDVVNWSTPGWVLAAAYIPVYAALMLEAFRHARTGG